MPGIPPPVICLNRALLESRATWIAAAPSRATSSPSSTPLTTSVKSKLPSPSRTTRASKTPFALMKTTPGRVRVRMGNSPRCCGLVVSPRCPGAPGCALAGRVPARSGDADGRDARCCGARSTSPCMTRRISRGGPGILSPGPPVLAPALPPKAEAICAWICAATLSELRPSELASIGASRVVRTASLGTATTFSRRSTSTDASPFMPGLSNPSALERLMSTGNIVTLCVTTACGSIFSTVPRNGRSGYASTVTVASCPGCTLPMSVSLNRARMRTLLRSAILSSVVPPPNELVADVITWPNETVFSITVPVTGARTVASSSRCFAMSREVRARITEALELAKSIAAVSFSCAVTMRCLNRSSDRRFCASET